MMNAAPKARMITMTQEDTVRFTDSLAEVALRMNKAESVLALLARVQRSGGYDGHFGLANMASLAAKALAALAEKNWKT